LVEKLAAAPVPFIMSGIYRTDKPPKVGPPKGSPSSSPGDCINESKIILHLR